MVNKKVIKPVKEVNLEESAMKIVEPEVVEIPEIKEVIQEEVNLEEKFTQGLDKLINAQILAGGTQYLPKESVLTVFRSVVKI